MAAEEPIPSLPTAIKDADASRDILRTLRHFHLGNPSAREALEAVAEDQLPALLAPFRNASKLRYDYPLFLFPPGENAELSGADDLAKPVGQCLQETVLSFAPSAEAARILKDNLPWIERFLREKLQGHEGPVEAQALINEGAEALKQHLKLSDENATKLEADLVQLTEKVPAGGSLLAYGRFPAIHLLIHAIKSHVIPRHDRFSSKIDQNIQALKTLLDVDWSKSEESRQPEQLKQSVAATAGMFDPSALSKVMDHSKGSVAMPAERRQRIENALKVLEGYKQNSLLVRFVHPEGVEDEWLKQTHGFEANGDNDPSSAAMAIFDEEASRLAKVFAAVRIANLEIESLYDPVLHDPWFENFNWEVFSKEELLLIPAVVALESADRVAGEGMTSFSRLLSSGRPVQVFCRVQAHNNPGAAEGEDPFQSFRTELGYLGIAHRQAVVSQASAARHQHLLERYLSALDATRTSLHLINIGLRPTGQDLGLNAWLVAGAALEGRVHPFFYVNPAAGDGSEQRLDFDGNPQPELDWPIHPFIYHNEGGDLVESELPFTFADYSLLIPRLAHHFAVVPDTCESDELLPIADYLLKSEAENERLIPFIWAVNAHGTLRRLVISRTLVEACRDRLNFWHTLQEMAGIRSSYIDRAIAETRATAEAEMSAEREKMEREFAEELARVRAEAAGEVMGRLTDVLMGMDFTTGAPRPAVTPSAPSATAAPAAETEVETATEETVVEEEENVSFSDPWIDSELCTTCNDCLDINPLLYVYNENNQAYLTETDTATYAQLVEGAEICPSKCIHPGLPQNPNEAGMEELIKRAAPFN
ncbi:pyruvate decarboxylase [Solemya pervernicosa gill symbiont]|uniref:Pyruvate decarboxylase n=2 Tax=Solemya pervernicosa gill symbiont TaxID=642797 RepID=A0A1T2L2U0_9GAMM|nr:pyruvate decarboxylase [Solemya pervernicosa gill symbiont]